MYSMMAMDWLILLQMRRIVQKGGGGVEIGVHRRRIKTEEKAKVVGVGWGTYLNAALTI